MNKFFLFSMLMCFSMTLCMGQAIPVKPVKKPIAVNVVEYPIMDLQPMSHAKPWGVDTRKQSKSPATYTFNYASEMMEYEGTSSYIITPDQTSLLASGNGYYNWDGAWQKWFFATVAQVFDFGQTTHTDFWNNNLLSTHPDVFLMSDSTIHYTIDSVLFSFMYKQGTNVPANTVDTILVSYAVNMDHDGIYRFIYQDSLTAMYLYVPRTDDVYYTFADSAEENRLARLEGFERAATSKRLVFQQKIPITSDYYTGDYFYTFQFPVPEELHSLSLTDKVLAIAYSFIPGNDLTGIDSLKGGENINLLQAMLQIDQRPDYRVFPTTKGGSDRLREDMNTSMYTSFETRNDSIFYADEGWQDNGWYRCFAPLYFCYKGELTNEGDSRESLYPRPWIGVTITCLDCEHTYAWYSVTELQQKNMTVYPNPASETFFVDMAGNTGNATVQLFNLLGQEVYRDLSTEQNIAINVASLKEGIYILKITQNQQVYTAKVMVRF
ncbi:MAG: T9SS type A sorting domain-containing protein [Bacteroidales bacterium]|jgi:hypothetical protein|nr:T9SS type A sorting domain-containing protein [Bacteroidales bacterium]